MGDVVSAAAEHVNMQDHQAFGQRPLSQQRPVLDEIGDATGALSFNDQGRICQLDPEVAVLELLQGRQLPAVHRKLVISALTTYTGDAEVSDRRLQRLEELSLMRDMLLPILVRRLGDNHGASLSGQAS